MDRERWSAICHRGADRVSSALAGDKARGLAGTRPGQYQHDLTADAAIVDGLLADGVGVVSEESGEHALDRQVVAVVDPVDGSTNASHGVPWYAVSICLVDDAGLLHALVRNLATGAEYEAHRGGGASLDGVTLSVGRPRPLSDSIIGVNGLPARHLGWRQYRALGAVALDISSIASGGLDAYADCTGSEHAPWDYLGAMLVLQEAGGAMADLEGRPLDVFGHSDRRTPIAASSEPLLDELLAARAAMDESGP